MATQNKSLEKESGSMGPWRIAGTLLLGAGLIAAYRFARKNKGKGGFKSAIGELKDEVVRFGETAQERVQEMIGQVRSESSEASDTEPFNSLGLRRTGSKKSDQKADITVAKSH